MTEVILILWLFKVGYYLTYLQLLIPFIDDMYNDWLNHYHLIVVVNTTPACLDYAYKSQLESNE